MDKSIETLPPAIPGEAPMLREATTATIGAVAELIAAAHPDHAAALKGVAPVVGYVVEDGYRWCHRAGRRIADFLTGAQARATQAGADLEKAADLIEQVIPIVGGTASSEKRRLLETVIVNAALAPGYAAEIEAMEAIQLIDAMTPEEALVFGLASAKLESLGPGGALPLSELESDLPRFLQQRAFNALTYYPRTTREGRAPLLDELLEATESGGQRPLGTVGYAEVGAWLGKWITEHPCAANGDDAT